MSAVGETGAVVPPHISTVKTLSVDRPDMRLSEQTTTTAADALADVDVVAEQVRGDQLDAATDELDALVAWLATREFEALLPEAHL